MTTPNMQKRPSLGRIAQSSSAGENINPQEPSGNPRDIAQKERFRLQRIAQKLLPNERIGDCMRRLIPNENFVVGWFNPDSGAAGFKNLVTCDSYSCPVCAHKRAEQDRRALSVALSQATAKGYFAVMITFTMSHRMPDRLEYNRQVLAKSYNSTFSGRWYTQFKKEFGVVGKIKVWETTFGANGWHEHLHALFFMKDDDLSLEWREAIKDYIFPRYESFVLGNGSYADYEHGLHVRTAESDIADYITKFGREPLDKTWGADHELARMPEKKSSHDGLTPFQILAAAGGATAELERIARFCGLDMEAAKIKAQNLYIEYFKVHKSRPRIYWSIGLKNLLEIEQKLSEVQEADEYANLPQIELVAILGGEGWDKIRGDWTREDLRGELLEVIRRGDREEIHEWLYIRNIDHIIVDNVDF